MSNKKITLTLDETLVKAFESRYGTIKDWFFGEFGWRAEQAKKDIVDNKIKEMLESEDITSIPGTEIEILDLYYSDKDKKDSEEG